ncbi:MAG: hypothetical protein JWO63_2647 [Frankiales bacterium]|jgi:hypothetical protein|nr:hypothetical protein [Frankiales bacterium]
MVAVLVLAVGALIIYRDRSELAQAYREVGLSTLLESALFAVLGTFCIERIWLNVFRGLGGHTQGGPAARVFFGTQLGKYLPGSVWPVIAQMEFGRRTGIGRSAMLVTNILMMAIVTVTGLIAGAVFLPWASPAGLHDRWWMFLLILPLLACLHPRVVPALLDFGLKLVHRPALRLRITPARMAAATAWGPATWVLLGVHILVISRALGASGLSSIAAAIGGIGLAFAAGLIFIPAPAGAGVREAVLVAALSPQLGSSDALAVALASRVLLVAADVFLAVASALLARKSGRPQPRHTASAALGPSGAQRE